MRRGRRTAWVGVLGALVVGCGTAALAKGGKGSPLAGTIGDTVELDEAWIYDDVEAGFARAKETGKPLMVVFRCVT